MATFGLRLLQEIPVSATSYLNDLRISKRAQLSSASTPASLLNSLVPRRAVAFPQAFRPAQVGRLGNTNISAAATSTTAPAGNVVSSLVDFLKRLIPSRPTPAAEEGEDGEEEGLVRLRRRVAVLGGTGRTGKLVVKQLVEEGHSVSILASSLDRAKEVLEAGLGLSVAVSSQWSQPGQAIVRVVQGSLQDAATVEEVLQGSDALVCCVGGRRGADGYTNQDSPEEVAWRGVCEAARLAVAEYEANKRAEVDGASTVLFDFSSCRGAEAEQPGAAVLSPDGATNGAPASSANGAAAVGLYDESTRLPGWRRLDDVIMGGQSESIIRAGNGFAVFEGFLRVDGGGFCGAAPIFNESDETVDASQFDGFRLRVQGDGRRYKLNMRDRQMGRGELVYQASFDTVRGQWVDVFVPFDRFRPMQKARKVPDARPINLKQLQGVQFVYSRFQYDGFPNPLFQPGSFRLEVQSVALERRPRTQFVLLSSAAVERSARAETPGERESSIPIVKLNPSGILSWKLSGEDALRASGLRYTVVRPCGLTEEDMDKCFLLESAQGDALTGKISREESAAVCVRALGSPFATNTTFEVRRDAFSVGLPMENRQWRSLFERLRPDVPASLVQYPAVPKDVAEANVE